MHNKFKVFTAFLLSAFCVLPTVLRGQAPAGTTYQGPFFNAPYVTAGSGLTASENNCTRPAYSACNIIYTTSGGAVNFTNAIATAAASGNSILAFVQTGAAAVTTITYPWQDTGFSGIWTSSEFALSTASITPAATSATIGVATQTFTLTGVASGDQIMAVKIPAPTALCPLVSSRATAANTVSLDFAVLTAAACTPAAGVYTFLVVR